MIILRKSLEVTFGRMDLNTKKGKKQPFSNSKNFQDGEFRGELYLFSFQDFNMYFKCPRALE